MWIFLVSIWNGGQKDLFLLLIVFFILKNKNINILYMQSSIGLYNFGE